MPEEQRNSMTLEEKLVIIKSELRKVVNTKSGFNKHNNFKYYQLEDFLPQTLELFSKYEIYNEYFIDTDLEIVEEKIEYDENNLPHRSVIKRPVEYAYLYLLNLENKEDEKFYRMKTAEASVYGASAIQNLGAKQTYMKRYVYMSVLDIVEPDEVDAAPQGNVQTVSQPAQQVTPQPPVNFTTNVAEMHKGPMSIQVDYEPQQPLELGPRIPQESLATNNVTIEATTGNVVVDEPMTLETKTAIAQLIITKGKNPAETIQEIAKNLGTPVEQFKESQKEQILQMIGSL